MRMNALLPAAFLLTGVLIILAAFTTAPSASKEMQRRVGLVSGTPETSKKALAQDEMEREASEFDLWMRRVFAVAARQTWGMRMSGVTLLLVAAVSGLALLAFAHRAVGLSWLIAVPGGLAVAFLMPRWLLLKQQRRAEAKFTDLFPDAVDSIVRMLRAGLPMTSAVRSVGAEGTPPVSTIFAMVADQVKIGIPIEEALNASSERIDLVDFRFFAVAVLLQYSTGGNIASTLEMLSTIIRKRRAMRMKAHSATAEIRLTAYVLGSLPFLVMGILLLLQPAYLAPLFNDPRGHVILGIAGGGLVASFVSMRLMMRSVTKG